MRRSSDSVDPPAGNCADNAKPWVLVATNLASSIAYIDESVVNVALPAMGRGEQRCNIDTVYCGGPGRPLGSRNRLSEDFLADLQADWEQHGSEILSIMRERHPQIYFQSMVKLALVQRIESASQGLRSAALA